jgi:3-phosphoinositide dependent protein kinase-1
LDELDESDKKNSTGDDDLMEIAMEPDHERRGTFVGTLNYVAPEMIQNNSAGMGTDIWSLGCIIYKLLTGSVPFTGTN